MNVQFVKTDYKAFSVFIFHQLRSTLLKYFTFSGRASRWEFFIYLGFVVIVLIGFGLVNLAVQNAGADNIALQIIIAWLILTGGFVSLYVRRVHDMDISGWRLWWYSVTGGIFLLYIPFIPGNSGSNSYGPPPSSLTKQKRARVQADVMSSRQGISDARSEMPSKTRTALQRQTPTVRRRR